MNYKQIAIIGYGCFSLQVGTIVRDSGYRITMYEQFDDVIRTCQENIKCCEQQMQTNCLYKISKLGFPASKHD